MVILTDDQRRLLAAYDQGMIADLVADPDYGIDRIRSTCAGGTWPRGARDDVPDWLGHYSTSGGVIVGGPAPGLEPVASIKLGQLRRWAEGLPARLRREMRETLAAERAENRRSAGWGRCPHAESPPTAPGGRCRRKHPGDVIWEEHYRRLRELWERRDVLLREAIWGISEAADPDQMALFEVTA